MGYQESYVRTTNNESFNNLINAFKKVGKAYYKSNGVMPVEVITLKKPITVNSKTFNSGDKFVYVVGERFLQRNSENLFNGSFNNAEIFFTESFPSEEIFENNCENDTAMHDDFVW